MQGPVPASFATVAIDFSYLLVAFLFIMTRPPLLSGSR